MAKSKRLIVFAGAGASYATDSKQYPTTVGFWQRLPQGVKLNPAFTMVETYLKHKQHVSIIDIEQILWELQELEKYCAPVSRADGFINYVHENGAIQQLGVEGSQRIARQYAALKASLRALIHEINSHVYSFYGVEPDEENLDKTWGRLLEWVNEDFDVVDIVTTNYDTVIESAIQARSERMGTTKTSLGRRAGLSMEVDVDQWKEPYSARGLLTKLHGSVDWQRGRSHGEEVIKVVGAEFHGNHDSRVIIYPGYKDTPDNAPFTTFHEYFERNVGLATHILIIGFAFRDDHINGIFRRATLTDQRICVVDPSDEALNRRYPFSLSPIIMKTGFGAGTDGGGLLADNTPQGFHRQLRAKLLGF